MLGEVLYLLLSNLNSKNSRILYPEIDVKGQAMGYRQGSYKPKGGSILSQDAINRRIKRVLAPPETKTAARCGTAAFV